MNFLRVRESRRRRNKVQLKRASHHTFHTQGKILRALFTEGAPVGERRLIKAVNFVCVCEDRPGRRACVPLRSQCVRCVHVCERN